jgi:agmatinase
LRFLLFKTANKHNMKRSDFWMSDTVHYKPAEWNEKSMPGSFARLPYLKTLESVDFVVAGIPFDAMTSYRAGTRFGPKAIREAYGSGNYNVELGVSIFEHLSGVDYGDFEISNGDPQKTFETISKEVKQIADAGVVPVILGGDHAITYPELLGYRDSIGKVSIIHFDSHTDTWGGSEDETVRYHNHGNPFRRAIEDGCVDPKTSIQLGMRGLMKSKSDYDFANSVGLTYVTAEKMHKMGIAAAAELIRGIVKDTNVIVTFDIDFVDPQFAPGTGTPVPGGFSSWETLELLRLALVGVNLKGFDLVEVAPNYDPSEITQLIAARIVHEFIAILAANKSGMTKYNRAG